jgi:putative membrane protein
MLDSKVDTDSRTRTHLANERTFLAWVRTGITLIALGLAAAQFLTRDIIPGVPVVRVLAIALVSSGVLTVVIGSGRSLRVLKHIDEEDYEPSTWPFLAASGIAVLVGLLAAGFILLQKR